MVEDHSRIVSYHIILLREEVPLDLDLDYYNTFNTWFYTSLRIISDT